MTGSVVPPLPADEERLGLVAARVDDVRRLARRADGVLLEARRDFAWLTCGGLNHVLLSTQRGAAPLLVTPNRAIVLAPVNEADRISEEEVAGLPIEVEPVPWWEPDAAMQAARRLSGAAIVTGEDVSAELESLRTALAPLEHRRMEWLGRLAGVTMSGIVDSAEAGQSEEEVGAVLQARFGAAGVRLPVLLAAADERIERYRHPLPTAKRLRSRLMVVVVLERWGLHVAQTSFRELEPPTDEVARRAEALERVLSAMRHTTAVGATLGEVLDAARAAYVEEGIGDEWELHHQGGTIGYAARERIAVPGDGTRIRAGMAFAWNSSARGYKLEETLYLDESGARHIVAPRVS